MNVALYSRVSTQEQAVNGYSIEEQIDRMTKYAQSMGWQIYNVYTDAGFSGASMDRPALKKLIKDINSIDRILVYKLDRLSRSQKDTLHLIEDIFLAHNTDFVSMSENFDTSTPFGKAMIGILAVFAQLEREQIRERMAMGIDARAKQGLFQGSVPPFGYRYEGGELVIDDFERIAIETAFDLAAGDVSPLTIARTLNEKGMLHRSHDWRDDTVRRTLRNKTYCGYIRHRRGWMPAHHEAIITEDQFEAVQRVLERRQSRHYEQRLRYGKATTFFGGFLYCAKCGKKLCKCNGNGKVSAWYGHRHRTDCGVKRWQIDELDEAVFNEIRKLALDAVVEAPREDKTPAIEAEIKKLDDQISRLLDLYAVGNMPLDALQQKIQDLTKKKTALEDDLDQPPKLTGNEAHQIAQTFDDILEYGTFDEIRSVIGLLIDKIVLDGEDIIIHWNFAA